MATALCVVCSNVVSGDVDGIPLSICCRECCTEQSCPREPNRGQYISKSAAKRKGRIYADRLDILRFSMKKKDESVMYLYFRREVEMLSKLSQNRFLAERARREKEKRSQKQREQRRLKLEAEKRKSEVEQLADVEVEKMDPILRFFMLRDYLELHPTVDAESVFEKCKAYKRAEEIRRECGDAHPDAIFDFCKDYPTGSSKEFHELREKMRSVFRLEGARILYRVPETERRLLSFTSLSDVYGEFQQRDARAITRGHLERLVGTETANAIMDYPACQYRLAVGGFETEVAEKLAEFWKEKDDVKKRTSSVKEALEKHDCAWRDDCDFCEQYIHGKVDCDIEEVVAAISIYEELQECHMCPHGGRGTTGHEEFCFHFYEEQLDFETSLELALDSAMQPDLSDGSCWDSMDLFDYTYGYLHAYDSDDGDFIDYDDILLDPYPFAIF